MKALRRHSKVCSSKEWKNFLREFMTAKPSEVLVSRKAFKKIVHKLYLAKGLGLNKGHTHGKEPHPRI